MRSNSAGEGSAAAAVLSTAEDGTAGDGTAGTEDRTAAPAVILLGGTGVCGAGAAGTGTVAFATVSDDIFLEPIWWVPTLSLDLPLELCECLKQTKGLCVSCWIIPLEFSDSFAVLRDWGPGFMVTLQKNYEGLW